MTEDINQYLDKAKSLATDALAKAKDVAQDAKTTLDAKSTLGAQAAEDAGIPQAAVVGATSAAGAAVGAILGKVLGDHPVIGAAVGGVIAGLYADSVTDDVYGDDKPGPSAIDSESPDLDKFIAEFNRPD